MPLPMSSLKTDTLPAAPERAPVPGIARDGAAKVVADAPTHGNMVRQQQGEIGFHHGTVVEDEPNTVKTYTKPIPAHPNMVTQPTNDDRLRGKHDPAEAGRVLTDAQNLGRKA